MKRQRKYPSRFMTRSARDGFVLIVVLIVIAMLAAGGYAFSELMFVEHKAVRLQARGAQCRILAESGVESVKAFLALSETERQRLGGHFSNARRFQGITLTPPAAGEPISRFTVIAPARPSEMPSKLRFGLASESSRLNLQALLEWDRQQPGAARNALMNLPAMNEEIADAILDWIDSDDVPREQGAESEYYGKLQPPYLPANSVPQTIEELLWVRGLNRAQLFGDDANQNGAVEPDELERAERRRTGPQQNTGPYGWAALLTLHSAEGQRSASGAPKIDLNQPDLQQLYDQLVRAFEPEWATFIVAFRQFGPYFGFSPSVSGKTLPPDFSLPARFQLRSPLDLVGVRVQVLPPKLPPFVLRCPFADDRTAMRDYLPRLLNQVTTSPMAAGRIDINEAPREVLMGIPGVGAGLAEDLIAKRGREPGVIDESHRHAAWPLVEGVVDLRKMKELFPFVTANGDVYRGQAIGYLENGPVFRAEFIVDATGPLPRLVSWKELEQLGRGYDIALLGVHPPDTNLPGLPAH